MRIFPTVILIALLLGPVFTLDAQEKKDVFKFEALDFYSTEGTGSRVDIYIEIPLENFEFKKSKTEKEKFTAAFDLTIDVFDQQQKRIYDAVSKEELVTNETHSEYLEQNSQILAKNLFLNPGKYKMKIAIYEPATQRNTEKTKDIEVLDFMKDPFSISNIMLVSKLTDVGGKKFITPSITKQMGSVDTFNLFFFIYKNNPESGVNVNCRVLDDSKKEVFSWSDTLTQSAKMQNQYMIPVPTSGLNYGKYDIEVVASNPEFNVSSRTNFDLSSGDFPMALNDIDVLIEQLQYIAKQKEMDLMKAGKTKAEKEKRFLDYWKSKDPTPQTKRNEVMNEYYKRLFYANKHFSTTYRDGWRTDMGMVFIIFGSPSNIERHPYDMDNKPYEVWDYYDLNKEFVFVDYDGFGDYRLITPLWETFRYQRNQ